ncbi:MAG: RecX family transcriptional regulator, partial [Gammaproteobacteria bacterium]|nr:RecX family transcriptional regulator [Gammaproteobacteria bacterium]
MTERLKRQGFDAAAAAGAVADLLRDAVLDDARCAENYVAYHAGRGHGPVRIAAELRRRGLADELIAAALQSGP